MNPFEPYYVIINELDHLAFTIFNAYCFVLLVKPFMAARERLWRVGAAYVAVICGLWWMPWYISPMLAYGIGTLAALGVMCLSDREDFVGKVFLAVAFFCIRWQIRGIVTGITNAAYGLWESIFINLRDHPSLAYVYERTAARYDFWLYTYVADCILDFGLSVPLLYGAIRLMRRAYGSGRDNLSGKEFLLLFTPCALGVFAYGVEEFYKSAYEKASTKSIYDLPGRSLLMILYYLACYLTILVVVYVFQRWKQEQREDGQRRVFSAQMKDVQRHVEEVERLYSDLRRFRHDMGNHLMTLEELYGRGEYEEAGRYAENMRTKVQEISTEICSGNPVTDAVLSIRRREMEEKGISFCCEFRYPPKGGLDAFDLSIILNNALANAVEASVREQRREIILCSRPVKNMYIIEAANVFTGSLHVDAQSGLPLTTKTEEGHGFGLSGIRHVARKYYGDVEIGVEDYRGARCCVMRVMLQIR